MEEDIALAVEHVSKDFMLPHERKNSIKEWVLHFHKPKYEKLHALRDINFQVKKGEFFGIVGRNGSGKSTMLKIIGGIYQPTKGKVYVNGTLTPFIELGIGFNPALTGRENVYLNGAILGLTRKQVRQKYDEIVAFAELEKFMDQKLKNYSSGMQVRLAFSIAIQAHNSILLIDEVLAVGDAAFQRKCFQVFRTIKQQGRTVILVTHDMGVVQEYCDRALMIQDSRVIISGKPRKVALQYEVANTTTAVQEHSKGNRRPNNPTIKLDKITLNNSEGSNHFRLTETLSATIHFTANKPQPCQFNLFFIRSDGTYVAGINTTEDLKQFTPKKGRGSISCIIEPGQLSKGDYQLGVGVYTYDEPAELIDVLDPSYETGNPKINIIEKSPTKDGIFYIKGQWRQEETN